MRVRHKLTASQLRKLPDGAYSDGGNLYLRVRKGSGAWVFRYMANGKVVQLGLGNHLDVSLADARELAAGFRKQLALGEQPTPPRSRLKAATAQKSARARTFREAMRDYITLHQAEWKNLKHGKQWSSSLETHTQALLDEEVVEITPALVTDCLAPIWRKIPETARRVRMRLEAILSREIALGNRSSPNPAAWADNLEHILPRHKERANHFAAVPSDLAPALFRQIWEKVDTSTAAAALALAVLTAARSGEIRRLQWSMISLDQRLITLPAELMKSGKQHAIPLSSQVVELIERLPRRECDLVFPNRDLKPLSDMSLLSVQRRLGYGHFTVHGWRSAFRSIMAEQGASRDLLEFSLAHQLPDAVEASYMRSTLIDGRRPVMQKWADFLFQIDA